MSADLDSDSEEDKYDALKIATAMPPFDSSSQSSQAMPYGNVSSATVALGLKGALGIVTSEGANTTSDKTPHGGMTATIINPEGPDAYYSDDEGNSPGNSSILATPTELTAPIDFEEVPDNGSTVSAVQGNGTFPISPVTHPDVNDENNFADVSDSSDSSDDEILKDDNNEHGVVEGYDSDQLSPCGDVLDAAHLVVQEIDSADSAGSLDHASENLRSDRSQISVEGITHTAQPDRSTMINQTFGKAEETLTDISQAKVSGLTRNGAAKAGVNSYNPKEGRPGRGTPADARSTSGSKSKSVVTDVESVMEPLSMIGRDLPSIAAGVLAVTESTTQSTKELPQSCDALPRLAADGLQQDSVLKGSKPQDDESPVNELRDYKPRHDGLWEAELPNGERGENGLREDLESWMIDSWPSRGKRWWTDFEDDHPYVARTIKGGAALVALVAAWKLSGLSTTSRRRKQPCVSVLSQGSKRLGGNAQSGWYASSVY